MIWITFFFQKSSEFEIIFLHEKSFVLVEFNNYFFLRSKFVQHSAIKETLHSTKGQGKTQHPDWDLHPSWGGGGGGVLMATFNLVNVSFGLFRG
jgi:hypothetical protein